MNQQEKMQIVTEEKLSWFIKDCLQACGFQKEESGIIADSLVEADLRGLNTHGVIRIPMYLNRVRAGLINPQAQYAVLMNKANLALLDAQNGMGQLASIAAMNLAIEKAGQSSVGMVGVSNSNHFGTAAYYSMMAASRGFVGIACSNTEPLMAAIGGADAVVGNNPLSIAIPQEDRPDLVLDMAMSAAAIGKIVLAQKKDGSIPWGWATDKHGQETTSAEEALDGGTLLPFSGPKGFGLALVVDVISGILTGAGYGSQVHSPFTDFSSPQNVGHMFMAINIAEFMPLELFYQRIKDMMDMLKSARKAPGITEVYYPGEIESNTYQLRKQHGIPLPEKLLSELNQYAQDLGVAHRL